MTHSKMTAPMSTQAFKYGTKTYDSYDEALKAELKERLKEANSTNGGYMSSTSCDALVDHCLDDTIEIVREYCEYRQGETPHPTIPSPVQGFASSGMMW